MTTEEIIESVSAHQPTLPELELPDYHGKTPTGMKSALSGAGSRITRPHTIEDRVVLVVEARVKSSGHESTDKGVIYVEKLKVSDLFELTGDQGSRLLTTLRSLHRTAEDAVAGRRPVDGLGEVGYTDGSGVVLTPAEVAELRNDPIRAILSPDLQPAVVVYEDGAKNVWPDEYAKDMPRPKVGDKHFDEETGSTQIVTRLLHHETGEDLVDPYGEADPANVPAAADDPDPFDGDLGDSVDGWETPSPLDDIPNATPAAPASELTAADYALVDIALSTLTKRIARETDTDVLRRMASAEQAGRGRGLKVRAGALSAIETRLASLEIVANLAGPGDDL